MLNFLKTSLIAITFLVTMIALPQSASAINYQLEIEFNSDEVQQINDAGQKVTINVLM